MLAVDVITEPAAVRVLLDPVRTRLLAELREPASAASLATVVGLSRQKIRYHLTVLARHGLVQPAGTRTWGGLTEQLVVATAEAYLVCPTAADDGAGDPAVVADRRSAAYLLALAARLVREVGGMARQAAALESRLPLLGIDTAVRFASPVDRAAFAADLAEALTVLIARYHDERAPDGRWQRVLLGMHPVPVDAAVPASPTPHNPPSTDQPSTNQPSTNQPSTEEQP